jgi:hypothetical protein
MPDRQCERRGFENDIRRTQARAEQEHVAFEQIHVPQMAGNFQRQRTTEYGENPGVHAVRPWRVDVRC